MRPVIQYITRKGTFDSGHRVMNERMKCFNVHGHMYSCQWIDDKLDHGMILNPMDTYLFNAVEALGSKTWIMSLSGGKYCNPTVENIAKEIFLATELLFVDYSALSVYHVRLYETPNCYTDCDANSISEKEREYFIASNGVQIRDYAQNKGIVEYDDRKNQIVKDEEDSTRSTTAATGNQ